MAKVLQLVFKTSDGKTQTLRINEPKTGVTREQAVAAMNEVVAKNIFRTGSGASFTAVDGIYMVTTNKEEVLI